MQKKQEDIVINSLNKSKQPKMANIIIMERERYIKLKNRSGGTYKKVRHYGNHGNQNK